MLEIMAYTIAVTAALTVVGHCLERLAALQGKPRRAAWVAIMALSVLFPVAMIVASRVAVPAINLATTQMVAPEQTVSIRAREQEPIWKLVAPSDGQVLAMWAAASLMFALYLIGVTLLLGLRAARWQRTTVLGHEVLISEVTGPALLGVLAPRIVVPQWLLQQPATTQTLILEHERQHVTAKDPLLMVTGLLVIVAVPWNLPLWWQWRRMRQAMEMDCDARVLITGADADTYADVLLEVTRRAAWVYPGALAMSEPAAALEQRIDHLGPLTAKHTLAQTVGALGLAAAGVGVALALDAPALPIHIAANAVVTPVIATTPTASPLSLDPVIVEAIPAQEPAPALKTNASSQKPRTESTVNKSTSIAVTVAALGAVAGAPAASQAEEAPTGAQVQTVQSAPARVSTEQIIANNDLNKDGIVTQEEAKQVDGNLYFMWAVYDMDRDGRIDVAELTRAMNDVALGTALDKITGDSGGHLRAERPQNIITNNDLDGDRIVTREEATKSGKALIRMWDSYDLNRDGKVDDAEVGKAQGE